MHTHTITRAIGMSSNAVRKLTHRCPGHHATQMGAHGVDAVGLQGGTVSSGHQVGGVTLHCKGEGGRVRKGCSQGSDLQHCLSTACSGHPGQSVTQAHTAPNRTSSTGTNLQTLRQLAGAGLGVRLQPGVGLDVHAQDILRGLATASTTTAAHHNQWTERLSERRDRNVCGRRGTPAKPPTPSACAGDKGECSNAAQVSIRTPAPKVRLIIHAHALVMLLQAPPAPL